MAASASLPLRREPAAAAQSIRQNWGDPRCHFFLARQQVSVPRALRRRGSFGSQMIPKLEQAQGELLAVNRTVGAAGKPPKRPAGLRRPSRPI